MATYIYTYDGNKYHYQGYVKDINGNSIVSPTGLNNIIQKLDKSGKLELIFGKKGAERYRTLNDVTKDVKTVPEGSVNYSGTASQLKNLVVPIVTDLGASAMAGVPLPVTLGGTMAYKYVKGRKEATKINEFLNYGKDK
jgi:isopentenyl phosphate kinase